jgi:3-oxoacyl-[acyl-carrier protein] reductase
MQPRVTDQGRLGGRVALITGAARGLGRAYALRLAGLGARVAIVDRDLRSFEEYEREHQRTTAEALRELGTDVLEAEADVTDAAHIARVVEDVVARWGSLDVLICNAGGGSGTHETSRASELDPADFDAVVQRNLYGTVNTCVAAAPAMKRQRGGKIITVASQAGRLSNADGGYAHYGAAKAGIIMYTRYLAQDLGPYGITVNCIAPGYIGTGRLMVQFRARGVEHLESTIALRRLGTPEDCARVIEFLATDLSDYVTGAVVPIDGGSVR